MGDKEEKVSVEQLSGVQKAAILLILIGEDAATKILREMSEDAIQEVTKEIAVTKAVDPEVAKAVL